MNFHDKFCSLYERTYHMNEHTNKQKYSYCLGLSEKILTDIKMNIFLRIYCNLFTNFTDSTDEFAQVFFTSI